MSVLNGAKSFLTGQYLGHRNKRMQKAILKKLLLRRTKLIFKVIIESKFSMNWITTKTTAFLPKYSHYDKFCENYFRCPMPNCLTQYQNSEILALPPVMILTIR